jgi:hypothetical protein
MGPPLYMWYFDQNIVMWHMTVYSQIKAISMINSIRLGHPEAISQYVINCALRTETKF